MAAAKKLPSGSWRVRVYTGTDVNGKRVYKSFTASTKREAEFLAAQYSQKQVDVNRTDMSLYEATERYIKSKENVLSPSTVRGYYIVLRNYVPELMRIKVRELTAERVQTAFNEFAKTHSPKTCRNAHGLVSAVLKVQRPELVLNTTLPQKKKRDIYVPDEREVELMYEKAAGTTVEVPFLLATQCGLRASEISALELQDVHDNYIDIRQARVEGQDGSFLKSPKSYAGYRRVPISSELRALLITNAQGNRICPLTSVNITNSWERFRKKHKINSDCNFHALRHHFASRCLLLGLPQKYTAELMGHSSLDMIQKVYQHTFPSAMDMFAEMLRKKSSELLCHEMHHENSETA